MSSAPDPILRALWARRVGSALLPLASVLVVGSLLLPMMETPHPPPIAGDAADTRFGLPLATRQEIFQAIVQNEPRNRANSALRFPDAWSREDDRCYPEWQTVHRIAHRRGLSHSVVFLILDEGIRSHWPGPNGEPLPATVPPLEPRRR